MKTSSTTAATLQPKKRPYAKRESVKRKVVEVEKRNVDISVEPSKVANNTEKRDKNGEIAAERLRRVGFQAGISGNPSGVPRTTIELKRHIRVHTIEIADALLEIVKDKGASSSARVQAATALWDRALGKAVQQVEHGGVGAFEGKSEADMIAYLHEKMSLLIDVTPQK